MFITINKKQLFSLAAVLFIIFLSISVVFVFFTQNYSVIQTTAEKISKKVIVDAGHGGMDSGAVSPNNTMEKEINLNIAMELGRLLSAEGYDVIYTRTEDVMLGSANTNTIRNKKVADLKKRLSIMQENMDAIFVSIHLNKFTQENVRGGQVFYSPNDERSENLAKILQAEILKLQPYNKRLCKVADKNIYLLSHSEIPAVIVECGFISNTEEEKLLINEEYQKQLAQTICYGIKSFYTD